MSVSFIEPRHLTASSTAPNSSNLVRRVFSSVCHARPLQRIVSVVNRQHECLQNVDLPDEEFRHAEAGCRV